MNIPDEEYQTLLKALNRCEKLEAELAKAMAMVRLVGADETEFNAAEIARKALKEGE
jgi:hypothetical protein